MVPREALSVPVNHHGSVSNGKIGELHRTDTGAANLENRHINVRPELDIVNGQPVFAGARAGAFRKACGGMGHTEVAKGIVAPAVVDLQAFNADGCEVEQQDNVCRFPVQAAVGDLKMGIQLKLRAGDAVAVGQGAGRCATVTNHQIRRADIALQEYVGEQVGAALRAGGGHAVDGQFEVHRLQVIGQAGRVAVIGGSKVDNQVAAVEFLAVTAGECVAGQGIGNIGIRAVQQAGVCPAGDVREAVGQYFALTGNIDRQFQVIEHGIVVAGQADAVHAERTFVGPGQAVDVQLGFQLNGDTGLPGNGRHGSVIQWLEVGCSRHRQQAGCGQ